jgi:hypothetical protein
VGIAGRAQDDDRARRRHLHQLEPLAASWASGGHCLAGTVLAKGLTDWPELGMPREELLVVRHPSRCCPAERIFVR